MRLILQVGSFRILGILEGEQWLGDLPDLLGPAVTIRVEDGRLMSLQQSCDALEISRSFVEMLISVSLVIKPPAPLVPVSARLVRPIAVNLLLGLRGSGLGVLMLAG